MPRSPVPREWHWLPFGKACARNCAAPSEFLNKPIAIAERGGETKNYAPHACSKCRSQNDSRTRRSSTAGDQANPYTSQPTRRSFLAWTSCSERDRKKYSQVFEYWRLGTG